MSLGVTFLSVVHSQEIFDQRREHCGKHPDAGQALEFTTVPLCGSLCADRNLNLYKMTVRMRARTIYYDGPTISRTAFVKYNESAGAILIQRQQRIYDISCFGATMYTSRKKCNIARARCRPPRRPSQEKADVFKGSTEWSYATSKIPLVVRWQFVECEGGFAFFRGFLREDFREGIEEPRKRVRTMEVTRGASQGIDAPRSIPQAVVGVLSGISGVFVDQAPNKPKTVGIIP